MTKEIQKNVTLKSEQISSSELLTELRLAIKDVFVCEICEQNEEITIRFLNGQKFRVVVQAA